MPLIGFIVFSTKFDCVVVFGFRTRSNKWIVVSLIVFGCKFLYVLPFHCSKRSFDNVMRVSSWFNLFLFKKVHQLDFFH